MADNQFSVRVPSALEALMSAEQGYDTMRKNIRQNRIEGAQSTLQRLMESGQTPDLKDASMRLIAAGDIQGGLGLANLARANAQDDWNRTYQGGMLDVARQNAASTRLTATKDQPVVAEVGAPGGRKQKVIINPSSGAIQPIGEPIGEENKLTSSDRKAIFDAEDENAQLATTRSALQRARDLAPRAFTGFGATTRATIGNNLPDRLVPDFIASPEGSAATTELNQLLSAESIQQMSKTLKGATTDREMGEFKSMLADPSVPVQLKLNAIDRMMQRVDLQEKINTDRMNQLRGGTYYKQNGGQSSGQVAPSPTQSAPQQQYQEGQTATNANGTKIIFKGGRWQPLR